MRSLLFAALVASAAAPAFAVGQDQDSGRHRGLTVRNADRVESRNESRREERSSNAPQRSAQPQHEAVSRPPPVAMDRPARMDVQRQPPALDRPQHRAAETTRDVPALPPAAVEHRNFEPRMVRPPRDGEGTPVRRNTSGDHVREWRGSGREQVETHSGSTVEHRAPGTTIEERNLRRAPPTSEHGELVQQRRPIPGVLDGRERRISRTPILGTEPPVPRTATNRAARSDRHWRTDWRSDHRYDWNNWRHHHRSHFHLGLYSDPFGWDYFRYNAGWRLWPSYYRSSYWLSDPWQYRLPPAYGPYRWVRYYDDAVLVNIYTGEVVDIVYNFFW